ncbi:MAG: efflux RND transporter periplasmic adaptor subunit [Rikenellaceae bacterium]
MRTIKFLCLVSSLLLVSCKDVERGSNAPRKVKCQSAVVINDSVESSSFSGKVVAAADVNLGFRVAGIIEDICVADGSYVRKGEVIARLDDRDYALQVEATQAEYDAIKAEVDRVVALFEDQSISANDYDKATNGLRAITAKLEAHRNALFDTELRAPFDGYIQKRNFDRGEAVAAGTPVISMISSSAPEIIIDIPASYYLKQNNFKSASATIELIKGEKFDLRLVGTSPKANLNQLHRLTFAIDGSGEVMPTVGMSAMVEISYFADSNSYVAIPFSAIVEREGKSSVWILERGKVVNRPVIVEEIRSDGTALLSSGIEEGDKVIVAGVNSLQEGQSVVELPAVKQSNVGGVK